MTNRFDYILSYWIFAWFILYIYNIIPYSPKLALILALIFEICILLVMIYNSVSIYYISLFSIITIFIKVLPLYILRNEEINYDKEIVYMISLFGLYAIWLRIQKENAADFFTYQMNGLASGKTTTPAISIIYPYMMKFLSQ
jgi:hypothetical protein